MTKIIQLFAAHISYRFELYTKRKKINFLSLIIMLVANAYLTLAQKWNGRDGVGVVNKIKNAFADIF